MNFKKFKPSTFIRAKPTPHEQAVPTVFICRRTNFPIRAATAFMVVLDQGNLMDALMSHPATRRFAQVKREQSQLKIGRMRYASQSLLKYHQHLLHFLAWCEYRGQAEGHFGRFSWEHLTAYRKAGVNAVGSLEDYERDQTDKRRPDLRSASPSQVLTRIGVANSFLVFCTATGYRQKAFSPYLATANKSYLDRHELRHEHWEIPEVEDLAEWVRSQVSLRNRVAAGLIVFGGLRVQDMLPLQRGDIPKFLDAKPIGAWRVGIPVFGKGGNLSGLNVAVLESTGSLEGGICRWDVMHQFSLAPKNQILGDHYPEYFWMT